MIKRIFRCQKGQSLTEFALVLPIILLLIMGTLTFGLLIYVKTLVVLSSSQAANYGTYIISNNTMTWEEKKAKIEEKALGFLSSGISGTERDVDITTEATSISVKVTYNYKLIFPMLSDILGDKAEIPIEYTSTYQIQQ